LVRADALLAFPAYTGLTNKTIPDTRRISAVEGTLLTYTLQLNKPVKRARLVSGDKSMTLPAKQRRGRAGRVHIDQQRPNSRWRWRTPKAAPTNSPPTFVLQVLTNRRPEVKLVFPRGDQRVSRLEEMQLQGEATGDFGL
jgi:hypothetical protein